MHRLTSDELPCSTTRACIKNISIQPPIVPCVLIPFLKANPAEWLCFLGRFISSLTSPMRLVAWSSPNITARFRLPTLFIECRLGKLSTTTGTRRGGATNCYMAIPEQPFGRIRAGALRLGLAITLGGLCWAHLLAGAVTFPSFHKLNCWVVLPPRRLEVAFVP